jgi:hypothetical protein
MLAIVVKKKLGELRALKYHVINRRKINEVARILAKVVSSIVNSPLVH